MNKMREENPAHRPWWVRAAIHFAYLVICLALTLLAQKGILR